MPTLYFLFSFFFSSFILFHSICRSAVVSALASGPEVPDSIPAVDEKFSGSEKALLETWQLSLF